MAGRKIRVHKGRLLEGMLVAVVLISLLNLFFIYTMVSAAGSGAGSGATVEKPPQVALTTIFSSSCDGCFDVAPVVSAVKGAASFSSERSLEFSSSGAKELISRYNISRLPAVILSGDVDKIPALAQFGERVGNAYVFRQAPAPYLDASTGSVFGRVSLVLVADSSCRECFNMSSLPAQLERAGIKVFGTRVVEYGTPEGRELVSRYNISKVPAVLLSKDFGAYPDITAGWSRLGSVESDGSYVLREIVPPYLSVDTGEVKGKVRIIMVNDSSCASCYDVNLQPQILLRLGLYLGGNSTVDVNSTEGRQLVSKYGITSVPTVLLSPDAAIYPQLGQVWAQVGTVEPDGWFVFRNMAAIRGAAYRNLTSGNVSLPDVPLPQP